VRLWKRIKEWRAERKAERAAIRRSQQEQLRAGDEDAAAGDEFEANRLAGSKPPPNIGDISGFNQTSR
jgi:hypothetical protein